jgi:L-threonylcarbamoyladenylate synthase
MTANAFIGTDIEIAATLLRNGEAVAIPTETVYGLAANALNEKAVTKIFTIKQRPTFDPLIVHLASFDQVSQYVLHVPDQLRQLAEAFMPGPLTILLEKADCIPDLVTAGSPYVAIRVPAHPIAHALLEKLDFPLAAPSANPFGYISPTTAQHVADQLGDKICYILDGGPCQVGLESTIVALNDAGTVEVLRKGGVPIEEIQSIAGDILIRQHSSSKPDAPGMLTSHYAPKIPLLLGEIRETSLLFSRERTGIISFKHPVEGIPANHQVILSHAGHFDEAARNLFAGLRYLDQCNIDIILAEEVPESGLGIAINDRLRRAAAERSVETKQTK